MNSRNISWWWILYKNNSCYILYDILDWVRIEPFSTLQNFTDTALYCLPQTQFIIILFFTFESKSNFSCSWVTLLSSAKKYFTLLRPNYHFFPIRRPVSKHPQLLIQYVPSQQHVHNHRPRTTTSKTIIPKPRFPRERASARLSRNHHETREKKEAQQGQNNDSTRSSLSASLSLTLVEA